MNENLKSCVDLLNDNDLQIRNNALHILLCLCDKIISTPNEQQYRSIRVDNPAVLEKLLPASGAMECLFEIGFIEDGEHFSLPPDASLSKLRQVQKVLRDLQTRHSKLGEVDGETSKSSKIRAKTHRKENFLERVADQFADTLKYEDHQLQSKARRVTPVEKLKIGAMKRLRELQRQMKLKSTENGLDSDAEHRITVDDFLLVELLDWFKNEFFTWVDSPACRICEKSCKFEKNELSNDPRISRIEIHRCNDCGVEVKFPRYTDVAMLLKTRRGRCGEWAYAFTVICRSLGFDARLVHDETDHVWTEVWSIGSERWIHADPCENAMDRPLMYERGWKKKLTYIIAYSRDEIQDVTWRYTRNQAEVMQRRNRCTEHDLAAVIWKLNEERQNSPGYSEARKRFVTKRRALELVEMITGPPGARKPGDDEDTDYGGRISGSAAWRTSRGEIQEKTHDPFVWKIPHDAMKFELRYNAASDEYEAITNDESMPKRRAGWQNGINSTEGAIFRKVENDWKMVYLVRSPGESVGKITWTFETTDSSVGIASIELRASCETFHGATVKWNIAGSHGDSKIDDFVISVDDPQSFKSARISGASRIRVTVEMSGGVNNQDWQHAQVFRQKLGDTENCSMSIWLRTCKNED